MDSEWWDSMTTTDTPNAGRCWWGWGTVEGLKREVLSAPLVRPESWKDAGSHLLRPPRVPLSSLPAALRAICTDHPFERLLHSRGRDFVDIIYNIQGAPLTATDLVAFPTSEADISALLAHCSEKGIAVVPYGAGSSVVFGVNPPEDSQGYAGTITISMIYFDKVLEVDEVSLCARVQGGIYGPRLERILKQRGLTLRYYPQSFEFSTLGGWIATRGSGHFATGPTHIDDMVESVRLVTPAGTSETRRLPSSGAGPAEHRLYLGSEGTLGIVTEAWVRLRRIPTFRTTGTIIFRAASADDAFIIGAKAVQQVSQAGLQPANLRLVYGEEVARLTQEEEDLTTAAVLLVGFEEADPAHDLDRMMRAVLEICGRFGGSVSCKGAQQGGLPKVRQGGGGERSGLAGRWGAGFMRGGYKFSAAALFGLVLNTFETAITWDRFFDGFHAEVLAATRNAVKEHCGTGSVTCRFTHVYPDGPAPYYTVLAAGKWQPTDQRAEQWFRVKAAAMEAVMRNGGTATHHHGVGKLHRTHYHTELGTLYRRTLEAIKLAHDPAWVLNPGVLLETPTRLPPAKL